MEKIYQIDINCDMGESYGLYKVGNDELLFPFISSCNIACGFHGGDPFHIETTIKNAIKHDVTIGAHPSYPDLQGFGRRPMKIPFAELKAIIKYQVAAIKGLTEAAGGHLSYVKPHGALYNRIAEDKEEALVVIEAVNEIDSNLAIMGLAGSNFEQLAHQNNVNFISEGFADRRYLPNGLLMPRTMPNAVIPDISRSLQQVKKMIFSHKIATDNGLVDLKVDSICIHGDNPLALELAKAIHLAAHTDKFLIQSPLKNTEK
jgi:UPF0271 protein